MLHQVLAAAGRVRHRPVVALTVILTLTLSIGANSAIFSAVDAILLKPLPYPDADRLVSVYEINHEARETAGLVAPGRLDEWHAQNRSFAGLAGSYFENMTDTTGALAERVEAMRISPRFFSVIGVQAAVGRTVASEEERFGGRAVVVVSDAFWKRRLNGDPSAVGRALILGGVSRTIVGVMPPSFRYPTTTTDVWVPAQMGAGLMGARRARFLQAVGRLKPGVTAADAERDLGAVQAQLGALYPETDKGWSTSIAPLKEEQVAGVRRSLWLLLGAVSFVLLAACGNIACLLLAEAARREHEIAVRFALGASRLTVVRQLLLDGLVLAVCGSALGLAVAHWATALLRQTASQLPRVAEVQIDARVAGFTLVVSVVSTLAFALVPALQATRHDPARALSRGGRSAVGGAPVLRRVLVAAQIAFAIVLLVGAGLLIRSFVQLQQVALGFDPRHVLTFRMSAQWSERPEAVVARQARTIERLTAIPGIASAAFSQLPPGLDVPPAEFQIVGGDSTGKTFAIVRSVSAGYFNTLRIPILRGDTCTADPSGPPFSKALITRAFADRYFAGDEPIGRALVSPGFAAGTSAKIVGVVGDVRERGRLTDAQPVIYWCGYHPYWPDQHFIVRSAAVSINTIRAALREIEPRRAVYGARPLTDLLSESVAQQRYTMILLGLFAGTASILAGLGLYGVLAQMVSARRREIGVRMALGARSGQIVAAVMSDAALMATAGIVAGLVGAFVLARFMASLVFGVSPHDLLTFAAVPVLLAIVGASAALVPARRAARTDPMRALRED